MAYVREEILDHFTDEELLQIVMKNLDELGIAYEEKPGGLGGEPFLDPGIFSTAEQVETFTIRTCVSRSSYHPQHPLTYEPEVPFTCCWADSQVLGAA